MTFPVHCKLTGPEHGYPGDITRAYELIENNGPDHVYTITHMEVGQSSTKLFFIGEYLTIGYNSVQFTPCDPWGNLMIEDPGCCIEHSMCGHGDEL